MQTTKQGQCGGKPKAILNEASKLPLIKQEQILAVIKGMLFTRSCFLKEEGKK